MDKSLLVELGFNANEATVYLSLLKNGLSSASDIAKGADINRSVCYSVLDSLVEKGLASSIVVEGVKQFDAVDPARLLSDLKEKEKKLKKALPTLAKLRNSRKASAKIEVLKGKKGVMFVFDDLVAQKQDYVVLGEEGKFQTALPIRFRQFLKQIVQKGMRERVLARKIAGTKLLKTKNTSLKFVPEEYLSPSSTVIYGDKTATIVWADKPITILIDNKDVADSYRSYFELIWKIAKTIKN